MPSSTTIWACAIIIFIVADAIVRIYERPQREKDETFIQREKDEAFIRIEWSRFNFDMEVFNKIREFSSNAGNYALHASKQRVALASLGYLCTICSFKDAALRALWGVRGMRGDHADWWLESFQAALDNCENNKACEAE